MRKKLLLVHCLILLTTIVHGQSVVINKLFNNTNTAADFGGSVNGQGDAIELLVLEDHTDLRQAYIKETYNIGTAPVGLKEGAIWQFTNHSIWSDLRAGTTIQLVRPPISTAEQPQLDVDTAGDKHLLIPLAATSSDYVISLPSTLPSTTWLLNLQLRDAVILKRGTTPYGFDDLVHLLMVGYASSDPAIQAEYDAIQGDNKAVTDNTLPGSTTTNGYMFFRNPTAETAPHDALGDYFGVDDDDNRNIIGWTSSNTPPSWGTGQSSTANAGSQNENFITYLRNSPKIEKIEYVSAPSNSEEVIFKVTFNKKIIIISKDDFDIEVSGATGAVLGEVIEVNDSSTDGAGLVWDVKVSNLSGKGNIRLVKKANTSISDGTHRLFNGFVYGGADWHAVDKEIVLAKPDAPVVQGVRNGASDDLMPTIGGTVLPNVNVNLYVDGVRVNTTITSNQSGVWSYTLTSPLTTGDHSFYITVSVASVVSEASEITTVNFIEYITGIPAFGKSVIVNKVFNSGATADDAVELLILDDHVDLTNLFIKDQSGNTSSSTAYNDNGGKYQFRNIPLWRNLRSGTTILLRKSPTTTSGYVLDTDPTDYTLDISLDDANYFANLGGTFNLQNYDMVVIKGGSSAVGYDNIIHSLISGVNGNTKNAFNNFPEPKMGINALIPTTNGFLYANNPTAATTPHLGITDYSGFVNTDMPSTVTAGTTAIYRPEPPIIKTSFNSVVPAWHVGETGTNKTFIEYLRAAPKIESIFPEISGGTGSSVNFSVTFNKDVTGVDISDFRVLGTNSASGKVSAITAVSGNEYRVTVSELSGDGEISLVKRAWDTGITDGQNFFLEGFEYLKSNRYHVNNLPVVIPVAEAPVIEGSANGVSYDFTPIVKGIANAGSQINLYIDGVLVSEVITAGITGDWSYQILQPLGIGVHTFYITTTGTYGTTANSPVTSVNFIVKVPDAPSVQGAERGFTNSFRPLVYGSADEGTTIDLYIDDVLVAQNLTVSGFEELWSHQILEDLTEGYHDFQVTATNDFGTSEKSEKTTVLFKLFTGQITVNNILTPNGDGKNDVWIIDNLIMYPKNEVMVYDKMGKVVYRQQNYQQDWDGTSEGRPLNPGTYYYHVSFGPDLKPLKGYITIIR